MKHTIILLVLICASVYGDVWTDITNPLLPITLYHNTTQDVYVSPSIGVLSTNRPSVDVSVVSREQLNKEIQHIYKLILQGDIVYTNIGNVPTYNSVAMYPSINVLECFIECPVSNDACTTIVPYGTYTTTYIRGETLVIPTNTFAGFTFLKTGLYKVSGFCTVHNPPDDHASECFPFFKVQDNNNELKVYVPFGYAWSYGVSTLQTLMYTNNVDVSAAYRPVNFVHRFTAGDTYALMLFISDETEVKCRVQLTFELLQ